MKILYNTKRELLKENAGMFFWNVTTLGFQNLKTWSINKYGYRQIEKKEVTRFLQESNET